MPEVASYKPTIDEHFFFNSFLKVPRESHGGHCSAIHMTAVKFSLNYIFQDDFQVARRGSVVAHSYSEKQR